MRARLAVSLVLIAVTLLAVGLLPRGASHAQDLSKVEPLEATLRRFHGMTVELHGVHGEKTIVPTGVIYTENRSGHLLFITRRTDSFVIPYSSILYFRDKPSTPVTPGIAGTPQLHLVTATPR
jgi:hypothetical protein